MLAHYLTIAYRAFQRNRLYSLLNIFGLTVGITSSLLIFLYVFDELTYDDNHVGGKDIYRLNAAYHLPNNGGFEEYAVAGPVVGQVLTKDFPEVVEAVRIRRQANVVVEKPGTNDRSYELFFAADSNIFRVFTMPFIAGDPSTALDDPFTLVITRSAAVKYFGKVDVLGESFRLPQDSADLKITGVMEDHPSNTQTRFDFIISIETSRIIHHVYMESWWSYAFYTYLKLVPGSDVQALESKLKFISRKYIADQEDNSGYKQEYALIPFEDIHLYSSLRSELEPNGRAAYVYIFLMIGVFILVIACINFMNLATARSAMRAKEIGLRKAAGALRHQLIGQFLGEAFLMTLIAMVLSIAGVYLLLPTLNDFAGKSLSLVSGWFLWAAIAAVTVFVALLAGSYPSIFLSAFKPVDTLKSNFRGTSKGNILRKSLVVFQFSMSIFLIAGTLIIMRQVAFIRSVDLGFDKEKKLVIPTRFTSQAAIEYKLVKEEMLKDASVSKATLSSRVPGQEMGNNVVRIGWDQDAKWSDMRFLAVDHDFIDTYQLRVLEGRTFSEEYPSDENEAFVLNESGMRRLGFTDVKEAIGARLMWQDRKGSVIGIVEDFHFMSTNVAIEPFIIVMHKPWSVGYLTLSVSSNDVSATIKHIEKVVETILPGRIFEYSFLDEEFDKQYKSEERFMTIFSTFSITAIVIACLGLYGLAMFMSELRYKEVGIRKVLGASESSLVVLMTKDFLRLVVTAFVLAIPFSFWAMTRWLSSFPYKEDIDPLLFLWTGLAACGIALLTVSYQAIRSARTNPTRALIT